MSCDRDLAPSPAADEAQAANQRAALVDLVLRARTLGILGDPGVVRARHVGLSSRGS